MKAILLPLLLINILVSFAQKANVSTLKIAEIMQGEGFIGNLPHSIKWMPDNSVLFKRDGDNNRVDEHYLLDINTNEVKKLSASELAILPEYGYSTQEETENKFYTTGPSLYQWDNEAPKPSLLGFDLKGYEEIYTVNNPDVVYYLKNHNLYSFSLKSPWLKQITNFKKGSEKKEAQLSENESYLKRQQEELFSVIVEKEKRKQEKEAFKKGKNADHPLTIYIGKDYLHSITISPDERYVTFMLSDYPDNEQTHVDDHVTSSGRTTPINARPKIGREDPTHKLGIFDIEKNKVSYVSVENLEGIKNKPEYLQLYDQDKFVPTYDKPKNVIFHGPYYSKEGRAIIEVKSYDNKDRWIATMNLETADLTQVDHQHDQAWIGGPGISGWNEVPGNIGWLKDNKTVYFQSEESGYSHLYLYDIEKDKKVQLTHGKFEIHSTKLSKDGTKFFVSANKNHPGNREFYHLNIKSKKWTPILTKTGNYEVEVSPDEKYLAYRYSYKNQPWELYVMENKVEGTPQQITHSLNDKFISYKWREPDVTTFKASDGAEVYARVYHPKETDKNNAAVIFVHGAGYLQNAHNWWSGYYREYMFNNLLADNGYTVLDIDYRASKGYGREWRTGIYRHMGGKDLSDHVDGRKYLIDELGIDEEKIGVYGGSYGGFITIMALLNEPGKFQSGAAVRSVTDWAHYNHEYTSNILNTPVTDSIAFRQSSPIYFADQLEDKLLMLHGMVDDNVQYQDVVRLSQRFIELGKTNWDLIGYPVEPHGFKESSSWTDEYGRIFKLFQETLR